MRQMADRKPGRKRLRLAR